MKKIVFTDRRAQREIESFPRPVQYKFQALLEVLRQKGKLEEPFGKKLSGKDNLFEIRVKYQGQWRALYAYKHKDFILILSAFSKKTQRTPAQELEKARKRQAEY